KNVTVFEALDAVRDTYGYEYSVVGTRIYVEPPEMQTRFYQVNYTLGQRRGVSDLQVVAGAVVSSSGSGGGGGGTGGRTGGGGSGGGGGGRGGGQRSSSGSSRADVSYVGETSLGERMRGVDGCADGRAVNVNQMSGTVLVRGMPRELRTVERLLRAMQINIE